MFHRTIRFVVLCSVALGLFTTLSGRIPFARAASSSTTPQVLIAQDVTGANCIVHQVRNAGTPNATTTTSKCLPGAVIHVTAVAQLQAVAQHEEYVLLSSATVDQVRRLIGDKRKAMRAHLPSAVGSQMISPNTCTDGDTWNYRYQSDYINGNDVLAETDYYINQHCGSDYLKNTSVELNSPYNPQTYWDRAEINNNSNWWGAGCPSLAPEYHVYRLLIETSIPYGADLHDHFADNDACDIVFNYWDWDLGALN